MTKLLPLLCLGWAASAQAGVRIESKVTAYEAQPVDTTLELQDQSFRVERRDAAGAQQPRTTIFDGQRMLILDGKDKTYSEMSLTDLQAQMAKLEQMKNSLPPEARAQLENQKAGPSYAFKRTSGGEKVAGISCENYQIVKDGQDSGTACLASWKASSVVTKDDLAPMKKLIESLKTMSKLSAGDLAMGEFETWPGWPLVMRAPDGHELSRVTKIARAKLPAGDFAAPADYTKKSMPGFGQ
jgi:hypothetical protein